MPAIVMSGDRGPTTDLSRMSSSSSRGVIRRLRLRRRRRTREGPAREAGGPNVVPLTGLKDGDGAGDPVNPEIAPFAPLTSFPIRLKTPIFSSF